MGSCWHWLLRREANYIAIPSCSSREGAAEPAPRRVSLRQRGVSADPALAAGVDSETPGGGLVLAAGQRALAAATGRAGAEEPEEPKGRHPRGETAARSGGGVVVHRGRAGVLL